VRVQSTEVILENIKDKDIAVDAVFEVAWEAGFDQVGCAEIANAVSEITGNAVKFAGKGIVTMGLSRNRRVLEITVADQGPGIKNIKKVMEEGYSSQAGSLGVGLNAAQRMMDEFYIRSNKEKGTTIVMRKYLPIPESEIEYGIISLAHQQRDINGDAYIIKEFEGDKVLLAVIDGVGQGSKANKVVNLAKDTVEENYKSALTAIVIKCHKNLGQACRSSLPRGVAMGLLLLKPLSLQYVGVGDTSISVIDTHKKIQVFNQSGIVGERLPNLTLQKHRCSGKIILIMCSDGISLHYKKGNLLLEQRNAQQIANYIMRNYRHQYGDATVLVVKRKR